MSFDIVRGVIIGCVTIIMKKVINKLCEGFGRESVREINHEVNRDVKLLATPKPKRVQFRGEL